MEWKKEIRILAWMSVVFLSAFFMPLENSRFSEAIMAMFDLTKWYAREHVVLCLLPAFFIAGVIAVFVSQGAVMKYFGAKAKKWLAYTVASVSGTILAVCSCTILPLFSSIHKRGAGLGPAVAFLYSGPAINILAIILTARILGFEMGVARIIGAVVFAIVIGSAMSLIYSTASDQLKMLDSGEATSVELTRAYLNQIRSQDDQIHAFLRVKEDAALAQAERDGHRCKPIGGPHPALERIAYSDPSERSKNALGA